MYCLHIDRYYYKYNIRSDMYTHVTDSPKTLAFFFLAFDEN